MPHSVHCAFAEHAVAAVMVPMGLTTGVGAVDVELDGIDTDGVDTGNRPTAWAGESPGETATVAPGRDAADSASCALTRRVVEPLAAGAAAPISACACAGAAGWASAALRASCGGVRAACGGPGNEGDSCKAHGKAHQGRQAMLELHCTLLVVDAGQASVASSDNQDVEFGQDRCTCT